MHQNLLIRVARHRREIVEPEIIQEASDSDNDARRRRVGEDEESSEEEEELDEEVRAYCKLSFVCRVFNFAIPLQSTVLQRFIIAR